MIPARLSMSSAARPGSWLLLLAGAALVVLGVASLGACDRASEDGAARAQYNEALARYQGGQWEDAAKGFLEARRSAGLDPELRFRAAFNLGLALARQADGVAAAEPQDAMDRLRESAAWFRDAVRLRPRDQDARKNLEVVLRRIQVLADQLNQGQNRLEARLDRVIEDQRALRDSVRQLVATVAESGSKTEPVAFQAEFDGLATMQRTLLADVGTVSDLAGDELGHLQSKAQADASQLGDDDKVRMVQLDNLEFYLQLARGELADTRRLLRQLQGDRAHRKADAGLLHLKRAREQLLDPVTVLKAIAQDQTMLLMHTAGLEQIEKRTIDLGDDTGGNQDASERLKAPAWLTIEHLGDRQDGARQRVGEVLARFQAAAEDQTGPDQTGQDQTGQDQTAQDPRQARVLEAARDAVPFVQTAEKAMEAARASLASASLGDAAEKQNQALVALYGAIERFSGLRDLIELTYRDHGETVALLTPPGAEAASPPLPEHLSKLDTRERAARIGEHVSKNQDRLSRLKGLVEDELAALDAKARETAANADPNAPPGAAPDAGAEQIAAARQQYEHAETLRRQGLDALTRLAVAVSAAGAGKGKPGEALAIAQEAMTHIEELRRLFFSIIEHLKELLRNQTDTHDGTGSAATAASAELASLLGPLLDAQTSHATLGEALADALAEQADAAAASGDPNAQDATQRLTQAAEEVRQATAQMSGAARFLAENLEAAASMSPDMSATLEAQRAAMERLESAIRLLEPPQQQEQQQDQQDQQDQQQQQQQDQQQQQEELSQQQAQRRLQEIRDREAERMRERQRQQRHRPEPVDKDW
jgi:Ca-activated chloride channel homolog